MEVYVTGVVLPKEVVGFDFGKRLLMKVTKLDTNLGAWTTDEKNCWLDIKETELIEEKQSKRRWIIFSQRIRALGVKHDNQQCRAQVNFNNLVTKVPNCTIFNSSKNSMQSNYISSWIPCAPCTRDI